MYKTVNRRRFIQTSLATPAAVSVPAARSNAQNRENDVKAIVIGSGFGGAVASLRLGEAGIETIVLERGIRWPITTAGDTFCTKENPDGRAAWLSSTTILPDPLPKFPIDAFTGVLDRKIGNGIIVYRGAGVGGGSLMYGGITYQPTKELFYRVFPSTLSYDELDRVYYPRVRAMLHGASPNRPPSPPQRSLASVDRDGSPCPYAAFSEAEAAAMGWIADVRSEAHLSLIGLPRSLEL